MYAHAVTDVRGPGLVPAYSPAPVFHLVAAMGGQLTAPVAADDCVDGFMRDVYAFPLQTAGYLSRRPLSLPYQFHDAPFQQPLQPPVPGSARLPGLGHVVGLVPYILAVRGRVAPDLTAYRRPMDSYGASNYLQSLTFLFSQVNCVPLLTG